MKEFSDPTRQQILQYLRSKGLNEPQTLRQFSHSEQQLIVKEISAVINQRQTQNYNRFESLGSVHPTLYTDFGESEEFFTGDSRHKQFKMVPIKREESMRLSQVEELENSDLFRQTKAFDPNFVLACQAEFAISTDLHSYKDSLEQFYRLHQQGRLD